MTRPYGQLSPWTLAQGEATAGSGGGGGSLVTVNAAKDLVLFQNISSGDSAISWPMSSLYNSFDIEVNGYLSGDDQLNMQFSSDTGSNFITTSYYWSEMSYSISAPAHDGSNASSLMQVVDTIGGANGESFSGKFKIMGTNHSSLSACALGESRLHTADSTVDGSVAQGGIAPGAVVDAGRVLLLTETFLAGNVTVYGNRRENADNDTIVLPTMIVVHDETSGTNGGTLTGAQYNTRTIDTEKKNTISGSVLASNQITLPAGTYRVEGFASAFDVGVCRNRIRDVTNSVTLVLGLGEAAPTANNGAANLAIFGEFTLGDTAAIELQSWAQTTKSSTGGGVATSSGEDEIFVYLRITQIG